MFAGNLSIFHEIKNFNKKYFFQEYIEMELKIFFITVKGFFEWQNLNVAIITFKHAFITCR